MRHVIAALLLASATMAAAGTEPAPEPRTKSLMLKAGQPVKFPVIPGAEPTPPPPPPKADPDAPAKLGPGQFYVVASKTPLLVIPTGPGDVTITPRKAPFMLPAAQAVGWTPNPTDPDFVTWGDEYPYIYVLKPYKSGDCTLLVFPATTTTDEKTKEQIPLQLKEVVKKQISVDDGTAPRPPPPKPVDPKVDPKPVDPPAPVVASGLRVLFVYENEDNLSKEQYNILYSTKIIAYLNAKCAKNDKGRPEWRKWDQNIDRQDGLKKESALWQQLWKDTKPKLGTLPQVVIVNDQTGVTKSWPATEDAMLELLQQYGGK